MGVARHHHQSADPIRVRLRRHGGLVPYGARVLIALALVFGLTLSAVPAGHGSVGRDANAAANLVAFRTDATRSVLDAVGAAVVESYGAFAIARGSVDAIATLARQGHLAQPIRASILTLAGGPVNVRTMPPPVGWPLDARGESVGVVVFRGPIKPEWREDLEAQGLDVLRFLPDHAYVVRGTPTALRGLESRSHVDAVIPYRTEWKIRPGLPDGGLVDVRIVLFPDERPEAVVAWLAHRGLGIAPAGSEGPGIVGGFDMGDLRWVRARIPSGLVPDLLELPAVEFVEPVRPPQLLNADMAYVLQSNRSGDYRYWAAGLDGRGQVLGMSDTGLDYDGLPFRHSPAAITLGDLYNQTDAARRKVVRYINMGVLTGLLTWPGGGGPWDPYSIKDCPNGHGTGVASTLAGNDNGIGASPNDGLALGAKIYIQDIGGFLAGLAVCPNESLLYLPETYDDLFGPPGLVYNDPDAPVRIHSNSWSAQENEYEIQARMVDAFVWSHPDLLVLFAAGNAGNAARTVGTPGTAKAVVTVGGAWNPDGALPGGQNDLASQSGRGPASDGRIKPTLVTIFDGDSAMSDGNPASGLGGTDLHWAGTSYSTPAAAAAAAIVRQYFADGWYPAARPVPGNGFEPSAALLRAVLIASGEQVTSGSVPFRAADNRWPNNEQGFGRVLLSNVLPIASAGDPFRIQVIDGRASLRTGEDAVYTVRTSAPGRLKIVLAWTDYPGTLGAGKALVNDLDLEVTAPDGTVYRGNNFGTFAEGQSVAGGVFDATNVEEAVILKAAVAGEWKLRVIGSNVPIGVQPFALVAVGNLDSSYGRVLLDRNVYAEGDEIRITVEDSDVTPVVVRVASGVEPGGEEVTLTRGGPDEIWRGSIRTAFGTAVADGILQVRDRDTITVVYQDPSPPHTATARARVEASGPVIHSVSVDQIGPTSARVLWRTDRPATSEVRYGTSPADLSSVAKEADLRMSHELVLQRLFADTTYYFDVVSSGRTGNATRDTNAGAHYRFRTSAWGDVLLVVGDGTFPPEREASYAAALDATGWTWSPWRISELGPPPLAFLQDRRAVIWQVGLEQYPPFDASTQALLKAYLDGGGRLLVSSHDTAWALASPDSPFYSRANEAWVRGVLKATFVCDPATIRWARGVTGDPISGAYTGSVPYVPHRPGGASDELSGNAAGGSTGVVWTDDQQVQGCNPQNQPMGLRWASSAANGTGGAGAWGGTPSRLLYFAFELTGMDATATDLNLGSPVRADVIDRSLRWLVGRSTTALDRDHPDVGITSPLGGSFAGPTISIEWTATAYGTGIGLAGATVHASADDGQTWTTIATLSGTATSFAWDITGVPNGNRNRVRVAVQDDASPSLRGQATSSPFTIARPGGDSAGPILWAGSLRVDPRPPGAGQPVRFNATADDRSRGNGGIVAAELFLGTTVPSPAEAGTGLAMEAIDGRFDASVENVTWTGALAIPPGGTCAWVHARDAAGNWGPYASTCFPVLSMGTDTVPPAPAALDAIRAVNAAQDLRIEWAAAWDEGLFGGTTAYLVLRATSPRGPFGAVGPPIPADGSARYAFVDPGRAADGSDYFYRIDTRDEAGNAVASPVRAAKVRIAFSAGINLLGMPVEPTDPSFSAFAAGAPWVDAWTYDACAVGFGWSAALPADPTSFSVPRGRGLWVNTTASGVLVAFGLAGASGQVRLCAGWNLVAVPGFPVGVSVADVKAATGADAVMGFDAAGPYHVRFLADSEILSPGSGYWVRVPAEADWNVPGW